MTKRASQSFQRIQRLSAAQRLLRALARTDAEVYAVGGAVRDHLLKRPLGDLDFVITGVPLPALRTTLARHGEVNLVGKTFGVLKFKPKGSRQELDLALPRTEHAFGTGGTRDVDVRFDHKLPIARDLARRDFTINAIAVRLRDGHVVDPNNGLSDLGSKQLRAVGNPAERFREDYSRILRGLRFAVELNCNFEPHTWRTIKELVPHLAESIVPRELIAREFLKAFAADPLKTIDLWDLSGAFRALMPETLDMKGCPQHGAFHAEGDVWTHARLAVEMAESKAFRRWFGEPPTLQTRVAIFLHDLGKTRTTQTPDEHGTDRIRSNNHDVVGARLAYDILERLRFSSHEGRVHADEVAWLIERHMIALAAKEMRPSTLERYFMTDSKRGQELQKLILADGLATITPQGRPTINAFQVLRKRLAKLSPRAKTPRALVRGDVLAKALGLPTGPRIGKLLGVLRDAQLEGRIRTKGAAIVEARRILKRTRNG